MSRQYCCDNCDHKGPREKFKLLETTKEILTLVNERLDPGGIFTDVECPKCGALAYPEIGDAVQRLHLLQAHRRRVPCTQFLTQGVHDIGDLDIGIRISTRDRMHNPAEKSKALSCVVDWFEGKMQLLVFGYDRDDPVIAIAIDRLLKHPVEIAVMDENIEIKRSR